jgi:hypothetical protein
MHRRCLAPLRSLAAFPLAEWSGHRRQQQPADRRRQPAASHDDRQRRGPGDGCGWRELGHAPGPGRRPQARRIAPSAAAQEGCAARAVPAARPARRERAGRRQRLQPSRPQRQRHQRRHARCAPAPLAHGATNAGISTPVLLQRQDDGRWRWAGNLPDPIDNATRAMRRTTASPCARSETHPHHPEENAMNQALARTATAALGAATLLAAAPANADCPSPAR